MEIKEVLDGVIEKLEKVVKESDVTSDEYKVASRQLMELTKQRIEVEKIENSKLEQTNKDVSSKKNKKIEVILKIAEIGVPILVVCLNWAQTRSYARMICDFEKDYTFTTSAGKGISGLFRLKR